MLAIAQGSFVTLRLLEKNHLTNCHGTIVAKVPMLNQPKGFGHSAGYCCTQNLELSRAPYPHHVLSLSIG